MIGVADLSRQLFDRYRRRARVGSTVRGSWPSSGDPASDSRGGSARDSASYQSRSGFRGAVGMHPTNGWCAVTRLSDNPAPGFAIISSRVTSAVEITVAGANNPECEFGGLKNGSVTR